MKTKRKYHQYCGLARALDVLGERWTLLIVRNLLLGPRRYTDFLRELPGITTNLLAQRLQEMEEQELIERRVLPPPGVATVYALTESGAALEPVVMELGRWGGRYLGKPSRQDTVNLGWGLLSLKRRYLGGVDRVVHLNVDGKTYELGMEPRYLRVSDQVTRPADLTMTASLPTLQQWLFGGVPPHRLVTLGDLHVSGAGLAEVAAAFSKPPLVAGQGAVGK